MGRLKAGKLAEERARSRYRDEHQPWRAWYGTARWQRLREVVLARDLYTCCRTGVLLGGKHPAPNSPVVDHIKPHRGDPALFWDVDNLQSVSKSYHDSVKQALERADQTAAIHPKWLKPSLIPLTIVCGPPASGKSTYVAQHKGERDLVIDLDVIASEISGEPLHGWERERWLNAALFRRNDMLGSLSRMSDFAAAWFIVSEPRARHREWWDETLRPRRIVVIEADEIRCLDQARQAGDRDLRAIETAIMTWWARYERRIGEVRLT